jgi:hypothetical protein
VAAAPVAPPAGATPIAVGAPVLDDPGNETDLRFLDQPGAAPTTKAQAWRWFFYTLVGFVVGQLVAAVFGSAAGSLAGKTAAQMKVITTANVPPEWYTIATLLGLWVGFVGAPWLASRWHGTRRFLTDLGVRFRVIDLVGIAIGIGAQLVIVLLYAPFRHDIHNFNGPSQKLTGSSHGAGIVVIILATSVAVPVVEELFFRGLLFKALVRLCAPIGGGATTARGAAIVAAVVLDGLLFGLAHAEWVQLAGLALFGMALAAIAYRTGRLGMNMVAHASFNTVALVAVLSQRGGVH